MPAGVSLQGRFEGQRKRAFYHAYLFAAGIAVVSAVVSCLGGSEDVSEIDRYLLYSFVIYSVVFVFSEEAARFLFIPGFLLFVWLLSRALLYVRGFQKKGWRIGGHVLAFALFGAVYAGLYVMLFRIIAAAFIMMMMI